MFLKYALTIAVLFSGGVVLAYPPAPGVSVIGSVRGADGWVIDSDDASIVFHSGETELARTKLNASHAFGYNYRVMLALDMKPSSGSYKSTVVDPVVPFTVTVEIGNEVFVPTGTDLTQVPGAEPGTELRLDFSLGLDSDGDGLPDEWEYWQLLDSGLDFQSPDYNLDQFSRNGDYDRDGLSDYNEFLAGTYAYLGSDSFELKVVETADDGWLEIEFLSVLEKNYLFEASVDMTTWSPVEVAINQDRGNLRTAYRAASTRFIKVSAPPAAGGSKRFYRATVE